MRNKGVKELVIESYDRGKRDLVKLIVEHASSFKEVDGELALLQFAKIVSASLDAIEEENKKEPT